MMVSVIVSLLVGCAVWSHGAAKTPDGQLLYGTFPDGFMWGTATAAYQIEGGWNLGGKGANIWDTFSHTGHTALGHTGDVACDSYHKFKEDVQLLKAMNVTHYRFSISWSRVMTDGTNTTYNPSGIQYYHSLIDELVANRIVPMATLYHWDLPQHLQDEGGWLSRGIVQHFETYARIMFQEYASKVPLWITFNEPWVFCWLGYGNGVHAPGMSSNPGVDPYTCIHHVILSHARAYRIYDREFRAGSPNNGKGTISITLDSDWKEPRNANIPTDRAAAERAMQFKLGWIAHPIFKNGDYPQVMKDFVGRKSAAAGLQKSRLPEFTDAEKQEVQGTFDFFGLNHYTTQLIHEQVNNAVGSSYYADSDTGESHDPSWPVAKSSWLKVVPWGLRRLLNWIKNEYNNPPLYITENGVSDGDGTLQDTMRVNFYRDYINNVLKAVKEDGCDVRGYTAWSLLDNFEWASGYTEKFGLHRVDFDDPTRPRTAKSSVAFLTKLFRDNGFKDPSVDNKSNNGGDTGTSANGDGSTQKLYDILGNFIGR